jgi:hypothetical protein
MTSKETLIKAVADNGKVRLGAFAPVLAPVKK